MLRKTLLVLSCIVLSSSVFAAHCPRPADIFKKVGNEYKVTAPAGWRIGESDQPYLDSNNVQFTYAVWASQRIDPEDERRVICIYGNPEYDGHHGVILETIATVDRSLIAKHREWTESNGGEFGWRYECDSNDVRACHFG